MVKGRNKKTFYISFEQPRHPGRSKYRFSDYTGKLALAQAKKKYPSSRNFKLLK